MNKCIDCKWWSTDSKTLGPLVPLPEWTTEVIEAVRIQREDYGLCETPSDMLGTYCGENTIRTYKDFGCVVWERASD